MRRPILFTLAAVVFAASAQDTAAQGGDPVLDSVAESLSGGQVDEARSALDGWFPAHADQASEVDIARARYYRARATLNADSAEVDYLWVAVSGVDEYAPLARLRLAQLHLASGDSRRTQSDLEMLRADFPGSPMVPASWMWTGVARSEAGDRDGACQAWREAESAVEAAGSVGASVAPEGDLEAVADLAAVALMACDTDRGESAEFTVQLGAFRDRATAEELERRVVDLEGHLSPERIRAVLQPKVGYVTEERVVTERMLRPRFGDTASRLSVSSRRNRQ